MLNRLFATKSLEMLHREMAEDEGRLRRSARPGRTDIAGHRRHYRCWHLRDDRSRGG